MTNQRRCTRSGQILVITLLGIGLLAGLVFYVVNHGEQVNRKVLMQNAADAAADAGSRNMARAMNQIASNNVAQTRLMALVPTLDAFPLSSRMALEETQAWVQCLENQLAQPTLAGTIGQYLRDGLQSLRDRMAKQRDILQPMDAYFNPGGVIGATITPHTTWAIRGYAGTPPHGTLWQAAAACDAYSQATAASASVLTQANAVRYGNLNSAEVAFMVPVLPELPAIRKDFSFLEIPVKKGLIPDRLYPQRLGPYDRLFKWRDYQYHNITEQGALVPGQPGHGPTRGGAGIGMGDRTNGQSARGGTTDPNSHYTQNVVGQVLLGYTVYGPYEWMRRKIFGYAQGWWADYGFNVGALSDTFFHQYHRQCADTKLGYMWGDQTIKNIHYPQYEIDYPKARALAVTAGVRVTKTMYYVVEIRSRVPKDDPEFLTAGSFKTNGKTPIATWYNGWKDPVLWNIPKVANWIWENDYSYETTEDWDIGIRMQKDALGQAIWQPVYMVCLYIFGGIDTGGEWPITNPANYTDRNDLPAPILLDVAGSDYDMRMPNHDMGVRRDVFTYLGVARHNSWPSTWPAEFGSGNPYNNMVAVAQAEVFNRTSWDLWTQDWKAQLVPVTGWRDWNDRMLSGVADAGGTQGLVSPETVRSIQVYMSRLDEQAATLMLRH